ncbi:amidase [Amphibiibacter pelophylacis]|uniref:Amidase n=1 Tax=Amphibiibacter pelophylacis TaxID=1799477 RepID=A0ACC6P1X0_9BURK
MQRSPSLTSSVTPFPETAPAGLADLAGGISSVALTELALARAETGEGPRVFTRLFRKTARAEAHASDALRAAGLARSPLEGLPISVKDLLDVAGYTTRAGSRVLDGAPPASASAEAVQRLRHAGAVIIGSTNMTEFAFSGLGINPHYGTPRNPWQRDADGGGRIPGGSSSGAAISITEGMAVAALGSDTGGSVRIPAALCGLVGFKPTARRVPLQGTVPLSPTLDSLGPLATSVSTCIAMDAVLSGEPHTGLRPATVRGLRFLVPDNVVLDGMDDTVRASWTRALDRLAQAGVQLVHQRVAPLDELPGINAKGGFSPPEAWTWHRRFLPARQAEYDPRVLVRIQAGRDVTAADYIELLARRQRWIEDMGALLSGFDALVMPTVPVVAPKIADLERSDTAYFAANGLILRNPAIINVLDGCAISLPCHAPGEAPVGFSLAAAGGQDSHLLSLALAVEPLLRG